MLFWLINYVLILAAELCVIYEIRFRKLDLAWSYYVELPSGAY